MLNPLLLLPIAFAQDAARLDPPLPIQGDPAAAQVAAFALPPQRVEYITDEAEYRSCTVRVQMGPGEIVDARPGECPPQMAPDAVAASRNWRFEAPSATTVEIRYVMRYSATLGLTTLHAEVDPGAAHGEEEGAPGLQLVRPPTLKGALKAKLPKAARAAGLGGATCTVRVLVDPFGKVAEALPQDCAPELSADAAGRVQASRWRPHTVDGQPEVGETEVVIAYPAR